MTDSEKEAVIAALLATGYEAGGRGPDVFDCHGLVIEACQRIGWTPPRDPGRFSDDPREILRIFTQEVKDQEWLRGPPQEGWVAFKGKFRPAHHTGLVVLGGILHTQASTGPEWAPLSDFDGQRWEYAKWVG